MQSALFSRGLVKYGFSIYRQKYRHFRRLGADNGELSRTNLSTRSLGRSLLSNDAVTALEILPIISISSRVRQRLFWADGQNARSDPSLGLVADLALEQNRELQSAHTPSPFGAA
jgi:hypothetical protein